MDPPNQRGLGAIWKGKKIVTGTLLFLASPCNPVVSRGNLKSSKPKFPLDYYSRELGEKQEIWEGEENSPGRLGVQVGASVFSAAQKWGVRDIERGKRNLASGSGANARDM